MNTLLLGRVEGQIKKNKKKLWYTGLLLMGELQRAFVVIHRIKTVMHPGHFVQVEQSCIVQEFNLIINAERDDNK